MKNKIAFFVLFIFSASLWAQGIAESQSASGSTQSGTDNIPLKKVVILTSGLAYYEHSGNVSGNVSFSFPFKLEAVNDVLKTLVINDPVTANPSVVYQAENTLLQTLLSLKVDLTGNPNLADILSRLRGTEIEITTTANTFSGKVVSSDAEEFKITINTKEGLRIFSFDDIVTLKFLDSAVEQDLNRALDLIASSRNQMLRELLVNLPGSGRRNITISYVIPSPVWKVSYRLDLGAAKPVFQGWAIVDNDSDTDWNNIDLSLVAGRPSSFIQELYPPFYVWRPVQPLAIAGTAEAVTHDRSVQLSATPSADFMARSASPSVSSNALVVEETRMMSSNLEHTLSGGTIQTTDGGAAGDQFEFTIKNPVTLNRRMSAMFPLVEFEIDAKKTLLYNGRGRHPRLGAELTNTSKMKLPAGAITVYDKVYAGDALLDFWNENEKRLISFGEDLSVTANSRISNTRTISTVSISGGVMIVTHHNDNIRTYTFLNSGSAPKQLITEHSRIPNTELVSPQASETTSSLYRFNVTLPAERETTLTVTERQIISERLTLLPMRLESLLSYSTNQGIPANVRTALTRAVELRRAVDTAETNVRNIETQRNSLITEQDRIRRNLEAVGNQSTQGQEYLRRLTSLDRDIDSAATNLERAQNDVRTTRTAFENYLNNLRL